MRHQHEFFAPEAHAQITELLGPKWMTARGLNAIRSSSGGRGFYMISDQGAIKCFSVEGTTVLSYHILNNPAKKVSLHLLPGGKRMIYDTPDPTEQCSPEILEYLVLMLNASAAAPYPKAPYGLLHPSTRTLVGIVFLTGQNLRPNPYNKSWTNLGFERQACIVDAKVAELYPFLNATDTETWLKGLYALGQRQLLNVELKDWVVNNFPVYAGVDPLTKKIKWIRLYVNQIYRAWDPTRQCLAPEPPANYLRISPEPKLDGSDLLERWMTDF